MISKTKVIRDILIIIGLIIIFVIAEKAFFKRQPDSTPANPHQNTMGVMGTMGADQSGDESFDIDNPQIAMKIDGREYSIGEIGTHARTYYVMMNGGISGLTKTAKTIAIKQAMKRILSDAAIMKGVEEFNIHISEDVIEKEIANIIEEQGGKEKFQDFLDEFNVTEDSLRKRIGKDLVQNALMDAVIDKLDISDESEEAQTEAFNEWLKNTTLTLEVAILDPELLEIIKGQLSMPHDQIHEHSDEISEK